MTLVKYRPSMIENFFNREFDNFFSDRYYGNNVFASTPAVNVVENKDGFRIEVAAPGMKKDDFKINLNHNHLVISAQKQEETAEDNQEQKYARREFSYSSFQRTFTLPQSVDGEKVEASYTDGILHVTLPKREEAKVKPAREISIA
jgi:HSP20 family protein